MVVVDSSVLILFARIGHFELLRTVFGRIAIPAAVRDEVVITGQGRDGAGQVTDADWITVRVPADTGLVGLLATRVHGGEAEVLALARELGSGSQVVLDDRKARRLAKELGLPVLGSIGVLVVAKARGIISEVRPLLDALRAAGLRLDEQTYRQVLAELDESEPSLPWPDLVSVRPPRSGRARAPRPAWRACAKAAPGRQWAQCRAGDATEPGRRRMGR